MADVKQLKHLEHLEDEMLNEGVAGCKKIVQDLQAVRKILGCKGGNAGFLQTKWDGKPAVICGKDPANGFFFVSTKGALNKQPVCCYGHLSVDDNFGKIPDLADKLKQCYTHFKPLGIKGIIQGDLLFVKGSPFDKGGLGSEIIDGVDHWTFKPNTIKYAIPKKHPIGKEVAARKIGVVFHTHYSGPDGRIHHKQLLSELSDKPGIRGETFNKSNTVLNIQNDTPVADIGFDHSEEVTFDNTIREIENECRKCGPFLDELVGLGGGKGNPKGEEKFHIAPYVKSYFNDEVKPKSLSQVTSNIDDTITQLLAFYHKKMDKFISGYKNANTIEEKKKLVGESILFVANNRNNFSSLLKLYKKVQNLKQQIIDKLDPLEKDWKMFAKSDSTTFETTSHEGYVLHRDGDRVKLVNRLEFSKFNFLFQ